MTLLPHFAKALNDAQAAQDAETNQKPDNSAAAPESDASNPARLAEPTHKETIGAVAGSPPPPTEDQTASRLVGTFTPSMSTGQPDLEDDEDDSMRVTADNTQPTIQSLDAALQGLIDRSGLGYTPVVRLALVAGAANAQEIKFVSGMYPAGAAKPIIWATKAEAGSESAQIQMFEQNGFTVIYADTADELVTMLESGEDSDTARSLAFVTSDLQVDSVMSIVSANLAGGAQNQHRLTVVGGVTALNLKTAIASAYLAASDNDHRVIALGTINDQAARALRALNIAIRWIATPFIRELILSLTASSISA